VARSLSGSGLLTTLGIHHHNRYNAFGLADDIMEPYRTYVDETVVEMFKRNDKGKRFLFNFPLWKIFSVPLMWLDTRTEVVA